MAKIEGNTVAILLDSGAEVSVLPKSLMDRLVSPSSSIQGNRLVQTFGGSEITLEGPRCLQTEICGIKLVHPFYAINADTPLVAGFDFITAAKLVIDADRRITWSHFNICPSSEDTASVYAPSHSCPTADVSSTLGHGTDVYMSDPIAAATDVTASLSVAPAPTPPLDSLSHISDSQLIPPTDTDITLPDHLKLLYLQTVQENDLSPEISNSLKHILSAHADTFAKHSLDIGFCSVLQHDVDTGDALPIKQSPRRPPLAAREAEDEILNSMLLSGVIEPSTSPWSSPVCLVSKSDGSYRFCVDYRKVNAVSKHDAFPVPNIQDALDSMKGARWFATIDLLSSYWQLGMTDRAKERSAFCTRRGLFHFTRMPFGLSNAPSSFCRLMSLVLDDLLWVICLCYIDDIVVYGRTQAELLERLDTVLTRLRKFGLKVKPSKCLLCRTSIKFLGHLVSSNGVEPLPDRLVVIRDWPTPHCLRDVRAFYGLCSYYRRYVMNFATIAEPLTRLTRKGCNFVWTEEAQDAFQKLKDALAQTTTLAFPYPDLPCILDTDCSDVALSGVLSQCIDGQERPIAFFSRILNRSQRNYCPTRRELLAVVASMQHFRHYLLHNHVILRTDHHSLKWLNTFHRPEGILARWIETLAEFDYEVVHRAGRLHSNADGASRPVCKQCFGRVIKTPWVDELERANELVDPLGINALQLLPEISDADMTKLQTDDHILGPVIDMLRQDIVPTSDDLKALPLDTRNLWSQRPAIQLQSDVLVRKTENNCQLVVPDTLRRRLFDHAHSGPLAAHLGAERTLQQLQQAYFWPGMRRDVNRWYSECHHCAQSKGPPPRPHGKLQKVFTGAPLDIVAMDILSGFPVASDGSKHLLVITDYFSKWLEAYPLADTEASTCMRVVYNNFFSRFGLARQLHSDKGANFESKLVAELCKITGINKTRTTAFHPRSDGQTERANRSILQMLRASISDNPQDWPSRLPAILAAYRMTVHKTTGVTPNRAMFGREVLFPCTLIAAPPEEAVHVSVPFVESFQQTLRDAHHQIRQATQSTAKTQKTYFDKHVKGPPFSVNQLVWLFWPKPLIRQTQRKLQRLWSGPWKILEFKSSVVVVVQHCHNNKRQTVHIDRLSPCLTPLTEQQQNASSQPSTTRTSPVTSHDTTSSQQHQASSVTADVSTPSSNRRSLRQRRIPNHLLSYV